jgi:hypothetical protein
VLPPFSLPEDAVVIFTGDDLFAIKVFAAASPVAGLAAYAHVSARRRRARAEIAESARPFARTAIIEIQASATADSGSVSIELTPHLLACLAAANSANLPGYSTPDSVMMAPAVEATWKTRRLMETVEFQAPSKLVVSREFVTVRSSSNGIESIRVPLRALLDAHRSTEKGLPLYCGADDDIQSTRRHVMRVGPARPGKEFYWVRAAGRIDGDARASPRRDL